MAALDATTYRYETRGKNVGLIGLREHSPERYQRHTGQLTGAG